MAWAPHVTVAVVVEKDGRYLLVEEIAEQGRVVYNQPAGHVEAGETLQAAACREALEETGWDVVVTGLIGLYVYTPPHNPDITYYRVCFAADAVRQREGAVLDDGIIGPKWLTLAEVQTQDNLRSPLVMRCVQDHASGRRYPLDLIHEHAFNA